jgi:hypothetical protein
MMKKTFRIIMVVIMLLGIVFSISNFICVELKAAVKQGTWVDVGGGNLECMGLGNECDKSGGRG